MKSKRTQVEDVLLEYGVGYRLEEATDRILKIFEVKKS